MLFAFPAAGREAEARSVLASSHLRVATAVLGGEGTPDQAIWLPVAAGSRRRRLVELNHSSKTGVQAVSGLKELR